ncbi:MAG TPA: alpha/beta fold hydrolase [Kiritimatiellia bacterium]|nr:alpha/beta fold hydrolase [Kiritimatiellia bacterium]
MTHLQSAIPGNLVTLPLPGKTKATLDGYLVNGARKSRSLLIFVHGMGSNFYKSRFKKAWMRLGPRAGWDVLSFNNRGCEGNVADENFRDCVADIDAALAVARNYGYRNVILLGHSTGCQKIVYHHHRRKSPLVKALILAGLGDDLAIARRDLGREYAGWIRRARALVANDRGDERLPAKCMGFSARRFLSAADSKELEAKLFHLDGELRIFRSITLPILAAFPEKEQYACIPVREAAERLARVTRSNKFASIIVPDADHSFHGREIACVRACLNWMNSL